jgi:hypothetical protein
LSRKDSSSAHHRTARFDTGVRKHGGRNHPDPVADRTNALDPACDAPGPLFGQQVVDPSGQLDDALVDFDVDEAHIHRTVNEVLVFDCVGAFFVAELWLL